MALPTQLKSARTAAGTDANTCETTTDAFEQSVMDVLGLTTGTNVNAPSYFKLASSKLTIPMAKGIAADQATTAGVTLTIALSTEEYDTDTMHDAAVNNSRLTATTAGQYVVVAHAAYTSSADGYRRLCLLKNGTEVSRVGAAGVAAFTGESPARDGMVIVHHLALAATDYVQMTFIHDAVGAISILSPTFLHMHRIGG